MEDNAESNTISGGADGDNLPLFAVFGGLRGFSVAVPQGAVPLLSNFDPFKFPRQI